MTTELTIEHALLGYLRRSPMHGYEIYQHMSDPNGLGLVWVVKQSRLYALLAGLEKEGYIEAVLEPQESRPPRKVFHLTESGEKVFLNWVQSPVPHGRQIRLDFLVKVYFAQQEGPETVARLLQRQRLTCESWSARLQESAGSLENEQAYTALVYEFRRQQIRAILDWLAACEQRLAAGAFEVQA